MMRKDENVDAVYTRSQHRYYKDYNTLMYLNVISYKGPGMGEYEN